MHPSSCSSVFVARCAILLALCLSGTLGGQTKVSDGERELQRIRDEVARGAYAEADRDATRLASDLGGSDGSGSFLHARALDLLVDVRTRNGRSAEAETLGHAEHAVRLKVSQVGDRHEEIAGSLHNLGNVLAELGRLRAAVQAHEQALAIRESRFQRTDPLLAESLEHLALTEILLERFASARQRLERAMTIRQAEPTSRAFARTLELQALLLRYSGNYATALPLVERAMAVRAQHLPSHPDWTSLLDLKGDLLFLERDVAGARQVWAEGLSLAERTLGPDHPVVSLFLRKLAFAADAVGLRAESRDLLERAVDIGTRRLAPCHVETAGLLHDSAQSHARDGDFVTARRLYQRELSTLERCQANANWTATALHNYGVLAAEMGDIEESERLHQRAIRVWSAGLGPNHPYVARGLDALAEVVASSGDLSRAQKLYRQSLDIRRRSSDRQGPDVAWTLTNLARTVSDLGQHKNALQYVQQALTIYQASGAFDEPDHLARALELQGIVQARRGDTAAAKVSLAAALAERQRIFGANHPLAAESQAALARVEFLSGVSTSAFNAALDVERVGRDHLRFTMRYLPERQALAYAEKRPHGLDLALSIAAAGAASTATPVLDTLIKSRGLVLDEIAARGRALAATAPNVAPLHAAAVKARERLANLIVKSLQEPVPRAMLDEARQQKETTEEALAERSVEARAEMRQTQVGLEEVRGALPLDAAVVSYVKYTRTMATQAGRLAGGYRDVPSYAAFVQRSDAREPIFVRLGSAATLDPLIKAWRTEAAGTSIATSAVAADRAHHAAASRLRRAVWDPLIAHLGGVTRTFVVPDGLLNVVNLAALPDRSGRYLLEGPSVIHYLSTERDLMADSYATSSRSLLAVGGPAFGDRSPSVAATTPVRRSSCGLTDRLHFVELPGSRREVAEIGRFWRARSPGEATLLVGRAATERAVKQALTKRRVIHFATHGFFLGGDCPSGGRGTRGVGGLARARPAVKAPVENPLLLAGLAFADANRRRSVETNQTDDGILTAEEIAGLQLQGTEWAVLSACDTGLGEIRAGEGVFGLRRAFQIAGARTVIMSLWSVEDEAARIWMRALYDGRLNKELSTAEAVRAASIAVLNGRRARGLSTHPFYWAGFVAAGDWR